MQWGIREHGQLPQRYNAISEIIREINAKSLMEIGVFKAVRSRQMILTALETPGRVTFYGFDLFEDMTEDRCKLEACQMPLHEMEAYSKLNAIGVDVSLFKGDSKETLPRFTKLGIKPDFIFIDGGHSAETQESDWRYVQQCLDDTTVIVFDDYLSEYERLRWGCNSIIDNLDGYTAEILEPSDTYQMQKVPYDDKNERILCQTQLVKVTRWMNTVKAD